MAEKSTNDLWSSPPTWTTLLSRAAVLGNRAGDRFWNKGMQEDAMDQHGHLTTIREVKDWPAVFTSFHLISIFNWQRIKSIFSKLSLFCLWRQLVSVFLFFFLLIIWFFSPWSVKEGGGREQLGGHLTQARVTPRHCLPMMLRRSLFPSPLRTTNKSAFGGCHTANSPLLSQSCPSGHFH